MDSANHFLVGVNGERIVVLRPITMLGIPKAEACNLAAWLTVLADPDGTEMPRFTTENIVAGAIRFCLGVNDNLILIGRAITMLGILKAEARLLAACLAKLADPDGTEVPKLIAEIKKS